MLKFTLFSNQTSRTVVYHIVGYGVKADSLQSSKSRVCGAKTLTVWDTNFIQRINVLIKLERSPFCWWLHFVLCSVLREFQYYLIFLTLFFIVFLLFFMFICFALLCLRHGRVNSVNSVKLKSIRKIVQVYSRLCDI